MDGTLLAMEQDIGRKILTVLIAVKFCPIQNFVLYGSSHEPTSSLAY